MFGHHTRALACAQVFSITEIVRVICALLEDDKRSLFYLSCCNKPISEAALDVLWAKVSMLPFVPFIPEGLRQPSSDIQMGVEAFLQLTCPPSEEWSTFDKYARRVRELHSADPEKTWMYSTKLIYPRLAALRAKDEVDLFPNLRSIIHFISEPGLNGKKLLPRSIQSLTWFAWTFDDEMEGHSDALVKLSGHAPLLEQLYLCGSFEFVHDDEVLPLNLKYLRVVDLTRVSMSACDFQYLCRVLCKSPIVEIRVHLRQPLTDECQSVLPVFPDLRRLVFRGDPAIACHFLHQLTSTALVEFIMEHEDCVACVEVYKSLLGLLRDRFSHSLKSVHLDFGKNPKDVHLFRFLEDTLMALAPLVDAGLEEVRYTIYTIMSTLPEELGRTLEPSSWPTLRVFSFSTHSERNFDDVLEQDVEFWDRVSRHITLRHLLP